MLFSNIFFENLMYEKGVFRPEYFFACNRCSLHSKITPSIMYTDLIMIFLVILMKFPLTIPLEIPSAISLLILLISLLKIISGMPSKLVHKFIV